MFKNKLIVLTFFYITSVFTAEKSEQELEKFLTKTQIAEYQSAQSAQEKEKIFKDCCTHNKTAAQKNDESLKEFLIFENLKKEVQKEKASKSPTPLAIVCSSLVTCEITSSDESPTSSPVTPGSKLGMDNTTNWHRKRRVNTTPTTGSPLKPISK